MSDPTTIGSTRADPASLPAGPPRAYLVVREGASAQIIDVDEGNELTNLPIDTREAIAFAVDCYRARWTIEEYFKALKTGCQFEKRQLESAHSLLNALAIFAPVAWRLLLLRHLARAKERAPASNALTGKQLEVLRAIAKKPLPSRPSARDAMLAVASLGGHIKNNGDPGWLVLGRGMHDLLLLEMGWRAREAAEK